MLQEKSLRLAARRQRYHRTRSRSRDHSGADGPILPAVTIMKHFQQALNWIVASSDKQIDVLNDIRDGISYLKGKLD
jgi:hypothetical protein